MDIYVHHDPFPSHLYINMASIKTYNKSNFSVGHCFFSQLLIKCTALPSCIGLSSKKTVSYLFRYGLTNIDINPEDGLAL